MSGINGGTVLSAFPASHKLKISPPRHMALHHISENIWVGSLIATSATETFKKENITHILSVLDLKAVGYKPEAFAHNITSRNLEHLYLDLQDVDEEPILKVFAQTNAFIDSAVSHNQGVLVHCIAGISRSVTVVCAYLMWKHKWSDTQAIEFVKSKRSIANPNDSFREQLKVYYKCGYEISDDKKPYREWLLKSADIHRGIEPEISYTEAEMPAMKLTWRHILPQLSKLKVDSVLVDGVARSIFEPVGSLDKNIELVTEDQKIPVSSSALRQVVDKIAVQRVVLRCKNCSSQVASSGSFVAHQPGKDGPCQHHFLEPVQWMRAELEKAELEGKLACPHCNHKIGAYAWQGARCSCGVWVVPSIRLQKGRIDCMTSRQKPLL